MKVGGIDGGKLRSLLERYQEQQRRLDALNARKAELFAEARAKGINLHNLKLTIQRRRLERQIRHGQALVLEARGE
jgi:uncharacterized protein (UPF0335 family)